MPTPRNCDHQCRSLSAFDWLMVYRSCVKISGNLQRHNSNSTINNDWWVTVSKLFTLNCVLCCGLYSLLTSNQLGPDAPCTLSNAFFCLESNATRKPWPALGIMFEVFGRTGPPTLGGGGILDPKNCHSLQCWPKNQKCCNQMVFASIQCSKMQLRPGLSGLSPRPCWGSLQRSPEPLAGFKGTASRRGGEKGRERQGGRGRGGEGRLTLMKVGTGPPIG